ncbi:hypothetical protein CLOP_g2816 [Closterium sp. NIES-67]|nr:hypothetical protein CLOP_g2816 [Closterium sp. NIES-67]
MGSGGSMTVGSRSASSRSLMGAIERCREKAGAHAAAAAAAVTAVHDRPSSPARGAWAGASPDISSCCPMPAHAVCGRSPSPVLVAAMRALASLHAQQQQRSLMPSRTCKLTSHSLSAPSSSSTLPSSFSISSTSQSVNTTPDSSLTPASSLKPASSLGSSQKVQRSQIVFTIRARA